MLCVIALNASAGESRALAVKTGEKIAAAVESWLAK
jgi:hypothetical protein